jgi:hypothetical protein
LNRTALITINRDRRVPVASEERTCSYCSTRQRLAALQHQGTSWICEDTHACEARAASSGLYAMPATDARLGHPCYQPGPPGGPRGTDPSRDAITRCQAAEARADAEALADLERLEGALDLR